MDAETEPFGEDMMNISSRTSMGRDLSEQFHSLAGFTQLSCFRKYSRLIRLSGSADGVSILPNAENPAASRNNNAGFFFMMKPFLFVLFRFFELDGITDPRFRSGFLPEVRGPDFRINLKLNTCAAVMIEIQFAAGSGGNLHIQFLRTGH